MQYSFSRINILGRLFVVVFSILFVFSGQRDAIFLIAAAPSVSTGSASSITKTSVTLSGSITDDGGEEITGTGFEYGPTSGYGTSVVATTTYGYVSKFGTTGSGNGQFNGVYDVAIDSSGNLYITDSVNNRVQKFDSSETHQLSFGTTGSGNGQFNLPTGIVIDSLGNLYVADYDNNRVQKFDLSGNFISQIGTTSTGFTDDSEGEFYRPAGLAVDSSNNLYVVDSYHERVQKFDSSGNFLFMFGWGVDTGANAFEICISGCQIGSIGVDNGRFDHPYGVAIDSLGNIYIADTNGDLGDANGHRIQKFDSSGNFVTKTGSFGTGNGSFSRPFGIAIDDYDNIFVADFGNNRIQQFDSSLAYVGQFGSFGTGNGNFSSPLRMAFDSLGNIYVTDFGNNRVQKFGLSLSQTSVTGLTCGTTYHFRAYATNVDGTSYGNDATFNTLACEPPDVDTISAIGLTSSDATLRGEYIDMPVKPGLTRGFEYGTTTSYGQTTSENGSEFVSKFGTSGSANGELSSPYSVFLDSSGNIYVADAGNNRISKFDNSGNWLMNVTGNGGAFSSPSDVFVDSSGNIFVADSGNGRVQKFDSSGVFQLEIGLGILGATLDVAVDSSGNIYVGDIDNARLAKFDSSGNYLADFASGQAVLPYSIDIDSSDNVYVADQSSGSIQVFNQAETQIANIGSAELGAVFGVDFGGDGYIYVAEQDSSTISKYDSSGNLIYEFGYAGTADGALNFIYGGVSADANGNVYVADTGNNRIQKFNPIFAIDVQALNSCTTYNYRAFATNAEGTGYGDNMTFTTSGCGGGPPTTIYGCTNSVAQNYNPSANQDDGSCLIFGCMDRDASNFDSTANVPVDDYCIYDPGAIPGCTDQNAGNYNSSATVDDGSCLYGVFGCMDPLANNYNLLAEYSNGSCTYDDGPPVGSNGGCTVVGAINYNPNADYDDGTCSYTIPLIYGCIDISALNFDSNANTDDGSCEYIGAPDENPISQIIGVVSGVAGNVPKEILTGVSVIGIVGPGIILNFLQPGLLAGLISIPIRLWNLIPVLMGYKRKKRPWGTVFDSVTKQPLDPVYVTLSTLTGVEQGTSITDLDGRYGFLAEAGSYKISANKDNYIFPSTKLAGKTADELYDSLYFGESIELTEKEGVIYKNIPMDSINFNWNEFAKAKNKKLMKFYSKRDLFFARIAKTLFITGLLCSLILFIVDNSLLNTVILSLYALILVLRIFGVKPKQSGYAYDTDGTPLSYGIIKLFSSELNREVGHTVIGKTGRYYMLAPNGNYYMKVFRKTDETSYEDILITDTFRVKGGYVRKVIRA